jgi:hypothetical protein
MGIQLLRLRYALSRKEILGAHTSVLCNVPDYCAWLFGFCLGRSYILRHEVGQVVPVSLAAMHFSVVNRLTRQTRVFALPRDTEPLF